MVEGGCGSWCPHLLSSVPPTPEEEPSLSSCYCQGNRFMSVHMVGTCVCPAPHVPACPLPQGLQPQWGGGHRRCGVNRRQPGATGDSLMWLVGWGEFLSGLGVCRGAVPPKLAQCTCAHATISPCFLCVCGCGVDNLCLGWRVSVAGFCVSSVCTSTRQHGSV